MKKVYKQNSNKGGVYQIKNIVNQKVYIGSTNFFRKRANDHANNLKKGTHPNKHLLAAWNKWGESAFVFEVLEIVNGDKLVRTTREQKYIDYYINNWDGCYNLVVNCVQGDVKNKKTFSQTMSETKKAFYKTKEGKRHIERLAKQKLGKTYEELYGSEKAKEIKEKIRQNKIIEMNKPKVKENLRKLLKGKTEIERYGKEKAELIKVKKSKARKGRFVGKESSRYKIIKDIILISANGEIFTKIEGIKQFASENNLSPNHLCELLSGKRKSHKGWKIKTC